MIPSIGRIVHVQKYEEGRPLRRAVPGVITCVHGGSCVDVVAFDATISEAGTFSITSAILNEGQIIEGWGWVWPPRG